MLRCVGNRQSRFREPKLRLWFRNRCGAGMRASRHGARRHFESVVLAYDGDDCLTWPYAKDDAGYGRIKIGGVLHTVSRLACEAEHGPPPSPSHQAAHSCGKGHLACCARRHVSWKTPQGNSIDRIDHGTTKLKPADVFIIRSLAPHVGNKLLAKKFGISSATVSHIASGKIWGWVTEADAFPESEAA